MVAVFAAVVVVLLVQVSTNQALADFFTKDVSGVQEKQIQDLAEVHRRHTVALKSEHNREHARLLKQLNDANARFDRMYSEHEYMSTMYQEQVRSMQEQEDRLRYLEKRLQEFGQMTDTTRVPFSAPPTQISFMNPPRHQWFNEGHRWPGSTSPLTKVVEAENE